MSLDTTKEWIKKFDKQFAGYWHGEAIPDEIKFFISKVISQSRQKLVKELLEEIDTISLFDII